jgi:hypothetical protein
VHSDGSGEIGSAAAAARLALLALRGNIHRARQLQPDAYALASAPGTVMTANDLVPLFVAAPKPLRCRATASRSVVTVHLGAPREGTIARMAWDRAGRHAVLDDLAEYLAEQSAAAGRTLEDLPILCGARDEIQQFTLADVARWRREYQLMDVSYAFDNAGNEFAASWPLYREARTRGISYILRFGYVANAA